MNINSEKPREMRQISLWIVWSASECKIRRKQRAAHLVSNLALSSADPWRPLNDGYAFQTCSDYSFDFQHRNHDSRQINLFVLFKDRRCLLSSRDNTISQQLTGVDIKTHFPSKQKLLVQSPRTLSLNTKESMLCLSWTLLAVIHWSDRAWHKIQLG